MSFEKLLKLLFADSYEFKPKTMLLLIDQWLKAAVFQLSRRSICWLKAYINLCSWKIIAKWHLWWRKYVSLSRDISITIKRVLCYKVFSVFIIYQTFLVVFTWRLSLYVVFVYELVIYFWNYFLLLGYVITSASDLQPSTAIVDQLPGQLIHNLQLEASTNIV